MGSTIGDDWLLDCVPLQEGQNVSVTHDFIWCRINCSFLESASGWKIHVAAHAYNGRKVFTRIVSYLLGESLAFKFCRSEEKLQELNEGKYGPSQIGKFITVYTVTAEATQKVGLRLVTLLAGESGPRLVTDWRFDAGSPIWFRYGPIAAPPKIDLMGRHSFIVSHADHGQWVENDRGTFKKIKHPTLSCHDEKSRFSRLGNSYLPIKVICSSPKSLVVLALDQVAGGAVLIKSSHYDDWSYSENNRAVDAVYQEYDVLRRLEDHGITCAPKVQNRICSHGYVFIIREYVDGKTLWDEYLTPKSNKISQLKVIFFEMLLLAEKLKKAHALGIFNRDLSPGNVLLPKSGMIVVDWDLAFCDPLRPSFQRGTQGFYDPDIVHDSNVPTARQDWLAFTGLFLMFALHLNPSCVPRGVKGILESLLCRHCFALNKALLKFVECSLTESSHDTVHSGIDIAFCKNAIQTHQENLRFLAKTTWSNRIQSALNQTYSDFSLFQGWSGSLLVSSLVNGPEAHLTNQIRERLFEEWDKNGSTYDDIPGLFFGRSGVALAMLHSTHSTSKSDPVIRRVLDLVMRDELESIEVPDISHGLAGHLICLRALWLRTADKDVLSIMKKSVTRLSKIAQNTLSGASWRWPQGYGELSDDCGNGFAHGLAGIIYALCATHDIVKSVSTTRLIKQATAELMSRIKKLDGAYYWTNSCEDDENWNSWNHGTPGVSLAVGSAARLNIIDVDDIFFNSLKRGINAYNCRAASLGCGWLGAVDAYNFLDGLTGKGEPCVGELASCLWIRSICGSPDVDFETGCSLMLGLGGALIMESGDTFMSKIAGG